MAGTLSLEKPSRQIAKDLVSTVLTEHSVEQGEETLESTVQTTVIARKNHKNLVKTIERDVGSPGYPGKKDFYKVLITIAYHFGIKGQDAEDCVQDYLTNLIRRGVPTYKYEIKKDTIIIKDAELKPYLVTAFRNQCKDLLRKRQRNKEIPMSRFNESDSDTRDGYMINQLSVDTTTPEEALSMSEGYDRLHMALAQLSETHTEIITLAYFGRFTYDQISMILGIPIGTVKSRLNSAITNLKKAYYQYLNS